MIKFLSSDILFSSDIFVPRLFGREWIGLRRRHSVRSLLSSVTSCRTLAFLQQPITQHIHSRDIFFRFHRWLFRLFFRFRRWLFRSFNCFIGGSTATTYVPTATSWAANPAAILPAANSAAITTHKFQFPTPPLPTFGGHSSTNFTVNRSCAYFTILTTAQRDF